MKEYRKEKAENIIKAVISELIMREEIKDPRVDKLVSVTRIEASRDLAYAKVYISHYGERKPEKIIDGLTSAAGFIQQQLGRRMKTKHTPKLVFKYDNAIKHGIVMNEKLKRIND